jgi:aerobic-type carbon monoxide dehydrogenase small subunit (CoxS/CutS family)
MDTTITLTVNGQARAVTTDPKRTLLDVLREDLHLTGTKYGCGEGQCRACTVLLNGEPVASCVTRIADADKKAVLTVEGLGSPEKLHPLQEAFLAEGAFQCGYCTPGMLIEAAALLKTHPKPSESEVASGLQRHICRCGNYPTIIKAVQRAATAAAK